jgi:glycosyltransferase involved in cell wall biosynthesis
LGTFTFSKVLKLVIYCFQLTVYLIVYRPDLVYFSFCPVGTAFYKDLSIVILLKLFRVRIVHHLHVKGIPIGDLRSKWKQRLYEFAFKNAGVICLTEKLEKEVEGLTDEIFTVNNGIPDNFFPELMNRDINRPTQILFLSNLIRSKGIITFLEALHLLHKRGVRFQACIVGSSADVTDDEVNAFLLNHELKNNVSLLGALFGNEKFSVFRKSDIFVFPTFYKREAFPLVILEAMQFQLPVISTYEGAIPEIVDDGETGFLITADDIKGLADRIEYLVVNGEQRVKMGKAARKKFEEKYTFSLFEENMCAVFNKILNSNDQ